MRIGVDATCFANVRGYGRFAREIVGAMVSHAPRHQFVCVLDESSAERFTIDAENVQRCLVPQSAAPTAAAASGNRRSVSDMLRLSGAVRRARVDAFFSPSVYSYFPLPPGLPAVITIHDAIAERFPTLTLPSAKDRWFWKLKVGLAVRQATVILSVSEYAADQVAAHLGISRERVRVTLEGVASSFRPREPQEIASAAARAGVPPGGRWLIYVGGFGPHKHVDRIVRAHARVARRAGEPPITLILAGPNRDAFHTDMAGIEAAIEECGTREHVRWAGYVPDEELTRLHAGAVALVLVSASEGFGLPAVEAARCGTPVVATSESPLPQILDGGGIFVPPGDVDATVAALERLLSDESARRALGATALARSSALSWDRSATVVIGALEDAAAGRRKVV